MDDRTVDPRRVPRGIELEIDARLKRITEPRISNTQDAEEGRQAVEIQKIGSLILFWGTMGIIPAAATRSIYLTPDGGPTNCPFTRAPIGCISYYQATGGLPAFRRAAGPMDDLEEWKVTQGLHTLEFVVVDRAYRVTQTNGTGADRDYAIHAWGI